MGKGASMETILHMTLLGSIAAVAIMLVNIVLDRWLKATWKYLFWLVVIIRFLVPIMPASSLSIFNYIDRLQNMQQSEKSLEEADDNIVKNTLSDAPVETVHAEGIANQDEVFQPSSGLSQDLKGHRSGVIVGLSLVWGSISIGMGTYFTLLHIKLKRRVQKLNRVTDAVTLASIAHYKKELKIRHNIKIVYGRTPSLVGIIRPTIILPEEYSTKELESIMLHELIHYKYKDHWIGLLQLVVLTIHWFNPIVWMIIKKMNRDAEFACDERVLRVIKDKKLYMETLVKLATDKVSNSYLIIGMESNKKQLKGRVNKMINPVKNKKITSIIVAVILVGISIALLTNKENHTISEVTNISTLGHADNQQVAGSEVTNILILGHANNQQAADTIMLLEINNKLGEVEVTSIPRDTKIQVDTTSSLSQIEGLTTAKVSEVLAYSSMLDEKVIPEEVCVEEIEKLLGKEIPYYINLASSVFADLVNELGGITVDVPQDMRFEDYSQELFIDLKKGKQLLNGEELEKFARYRVFPRGDLERIENQQYILESIMKEITEKKIEVKELINLAKKVKEGMTTNMQMRDLTQYISLIDKIRVENIKFTTAQGEIQIEDGRGYYILE